MPVSIPLRFAGAALLFFAAQLAHAQYVWIDANGTRQYSDRPPPPGTPPHKILKAPGRLASAPAPEASLGAANPATPEARPAAPKGPPTLAEREQAFRKRTQPLHRASAGCIFQNPGPAVPLPAGVPPSAGALVDRAGLKGARCGGAEVSTLHANFIVVAPGSSASDVRALVDRCRAAVREGSDVGLIEEIVYLGDWPAAAESDR